MWSPPDGVCGVSSLEAETGMTSPPPWAWSQHQPGARGRDFNLRRSQSVETKCKHQYKDQAWSIQNNPKLKTHLQLKSVTQNIAFICKTLNELIEEIGRRHINTKNDLFASAH